MEKLFSVLGRKLQEVHSVNGDELRTDPQSSDHNICTGVSQTTVGGQRHQELLSQKTGALKTCDGHYVNS